MSLHFLVMQADSLVYGTIIKEYVVCEKLGEGGFGSVYRVMKKMQSFAMKVIAKAQISDVDDQRRLQLEIDTMAYIKSPHLVALHDFFSDNDNFYLVMDYCQGGDLAEYLYNNVNLRESVAATIFKQIVLGVSYLHSHGIAHRDLKPHNILFTSFPHVKVGDFGLCGYAQVDKMKTFCGSPCYTAPECLSRIEYHGRAADMWSLGVILYELVTGHHPWDITNLPNMVKQICAGKYTMPVAVSPACKDLIQSLLRVKPTDRMKSDQVLSHPWLKLARSRTSTLAPPSLRRSAIVFKLTRSGTDPHCGIISPFERDLAAEIEVVRGTKSRPIQQLLLARRSQETNKL